MAACRNYVVNVPLCPVAGAHGAAFWMPASATTEVSVSRAAVTGPFRRDKRMSAWFLVRKPTIPSKSQQIRAPAPSGLVNWCGRLLKMTPCWAYKRKAGPFWAGLPRLKSWLLAGMHQGKDTNELAISLNSKRPRSGNSTYGSPIRYRRRPPYHVCWNRMLPPHALADDAASLNL